MDRILTVVIPSYNVEKFIPETIPTFLDPKVLHKIEILIINDGSIDSTERIATEFQQKYPDTIKVITKTNGGHGSTINTGIRNANGKYLKVVDGDDWVDKQMFCNYVEKIEKVDSDLVITPHNWIDAETGESTYEIRYPNLEENIIYGLDKLIGSDFNMHSLTYKTSILKKIEPISEHCYYVDVEFALYPLKYVESVSYIDEAIYQYRFGYSDQSMSMINRIKNRNMHLRVLNNIIELYRSENMSDNARRLVRDRLIAMCEQHMIVLLNMNISHRNKEEIRTFVFDIREKIPDLKLLIPGRINQSIIRSNAALYFPMAIAIRLKNKYKK